MTGPGMSDEKITEVLDLYEAALGTAGGDERIRHLRTMIPQMREFLVEGRREKVMRWLGFMQGVLWTLRIFTIEQLKDHNKPHDAEFDPGV